MIRPDTSQPGAVQRYFRDTASDNRERIERTGRAGSTATTPVRRSTQLSDALAQIKQRLNRITSSSPDVFDIQRKIYAREAPGANVDRTLEVFARQQQEPEYPGESSSAIRIRDLQARQGVGSIQDLYNLLVKESEGAKLNELIYTFPTNLEADRKNATNIFNRLQSASQPNGDFQEAFEDVFSGTKISKAQMEAFRSDIFSAKEQALKDEIIDAIVFSNLVGTENKPFDVLINTTPNEVMRDITIREYVAQIKRDNPNTELDTNKLIRLAEGELDGDYGFGQGLKMMDRLGMSVGDPEGDAIISAYTKFAEDKGSIRDRPGSFPKNKDKSLFGGIPVLSKVEDIAGSVYDVAMDDVVKAGLHQFTKSAEYGQIQAFRLARNPLAKHISPDDPIAYDFDKIPERARDAVSRNGIKIMFEMSKNEQRTFIDILAQGPPPKDINQQAITGSKEYTDEEYEEWVDAVYAQQLDVVDHAINFGVDVGVDPLNLLFAIKLPNSVKSIEAVLQAQQDIKRGQNLGISQRVLTAAREKNLLVLPGGQAFSIATNPQLRSAYFANRSLTSSEAITNWNNRISNIRKFRVFGRNIPNPVKTQFSYSSKYNQAGDLSARSTNNLSALYAIADTYENPSEAIIKVLDEAHEAWKADPENLRGVSAFFEKNGMIGREYEHSLMRIIGEKGDEIIPAIKAYVEKKGDKLDYVSLKGIIRDKVFNTGADHIFKLMGGGPGVTYKAFQVQNWMRGSLSRIYLVGMPFNVRNYTTDSANMVLNGISPIRNTEQMSKDLVEMGFGEAIIHGPGPNELEMGKIVDINSFNKSTKENPLKTWGKFILGYRGTVTDLEKRTRINIWGARAHEWRKGADEVLRGELDNIIDETAVICNSPCNIDEVDAIKGEIYRIVDQDPSPGAFEGLINNIKKGYIKNRVNIQQAVGAEFPSHLPTSLLRNTGKKITKMNDAERRGYLLNKSRDLGNDLARSIGTYTNHPLAREAVEMATESFIREMDLWVGKGLNTEEAMARAMPIMLTRMRNTSALRSLTNLIRTEDLWLAGELERKISFVEKSIAQQNADILNKITDAGNFFSDGTAASRLKVWDKAYESLLKDIRKTMREHGYTDQVLFGNEVRGSLGLSDKMGLNELYGRLDSAAADVAPLMWYYRKMANSTELGRKITTLKVANSNRKTLINTVETISKRRRKLYSGAIDFAQEEANRIILNYNDTGDLDFLMKFVAPWQFWPTRMWPRYLELAARKPHYTAFLAKINEKFDENPDLLKLKGKVKLPFIGDIGELGTPYIDPIRLFLPTDFISTINFDSETETTFGKLSAGLGTYGLGMNPALDAIAGVTGLKGDSPYSKSISPTPWENLANVAVFPTLNYLGVSNRTTFRTTPTVTNNIGKELFAMMFSSEEGQWTTEDYNRAILEWNKLFNKDRNVFQEIFDNPVITDPMLKEAYSRVTNRYRAENTFRLATGVGIAFSPPGYSDGIKMRTDLAPFIDEARRQAAAGDDTLLQKMYNDPNFSLAMTPKPASVTEREANRWLARNEYWTNINQIDNELELKNSQISLFDPSLPSNKLDAANKKKLILASITKKYGLTEEEVINSRSLAADLSSLQLRFIRGEISSEGVANAFNINLARQYADLLYVDSDNFIDQDGVFDGSSYHKATSLMLSTIPERFAKAAQTWQKRDATAGQAIQQAYSELFINPMYGGINRINQELDKEVRSLAIEAWKSSAPLPDDATIISWIQQNYPNVNPEEVATLLKTETLPNFELYSIIKTEEQITTLENNGQPFRSSNDSLVNKDNLSEYVQAYSEFQLWAFAKNHGLPTKGLWTESVEKYWGSGGDNASLIKRLREIDSELEDIIRNSGATTDADIAGLLEDENIQKLIQEKSDVEEAIVVGDRRDNFFNGRTASFGYSSSKGEPVPFTNTGIAIIMAAGGNEQWFLSIEKAINQGGQLESGLASQLFAIFQRHPMGYKDFNEWLISAYNTWNQIGRPGKDLVTHRLGELARGLGPGETTSIQE